MKIAIALSLLLSVTCAVAGPKPSPLPNTITAADIAKTEQHRDQLVNQLQSELTSEKSDHLKVANSLADATKANLELQKKNDALAQTANTLSAKLSAAEKSLWWYRLNWWGAWVMLGLGIAACLFVAFLKYTGKLAAAGAVVASKIP